MRNLDKRLTRLEKAVIPDGKRFAVVTYDVPIQIVPLVALNVDGTRCAMRE